MIPSKYDIELYCGDTFDLTLKFADKESEPVDLTGCSVRSEIRSNNGVGDVVASFTADVVDPLAGQISLSLLPSETATLYQHSKMKYDVQVTGADGRVATYVVGSVKAIRDVTQ